MRKELTPELPRKTEKSWTSGSTTSRSTFASFTCALVRNWAKWWLLYKFHRLDLVWLHFMSLWVSNQAKTSFWIDGPLRIQVVNIQKCPKKESQHIRKEWLTQAVNSPLWQSVSPVQYLNPLNRLRISTIRIVATDMILVIIKIPSGSWPWKNPSGFGSASRANEGTPWNLNMITFLSKPEWKKTKLEISKNHSSLKTKMKVWKAIEAMIW